MVNVSPCCVSVGSWMEGGNGRGASVSIHKPGSDDSLSAKRQAKSTHKTLSRPTSLCMN